MRSYINNPKKKLPPYINCIKLPAMEVHERLRNDHSRCSSEKVRKDYSYAYKKRQVLQIPGSKITRGPSLSIMTYNVFGPCGYDRYDMSDTFNPNRARQYFLAHEIGSYDPDIICLQEVYRGEGSILEHCLGDLGYKLIFSERDTKYTMAIAFKDNFFPLALRMVQKYLEDIFFDSDYRYGRSHCAMLVGLTFKDEFLEGYSMTVKEGIIVVNTHLPAKRNMKRRRTQESVALLKLIQNFELSCSVRTDLTESYVFLAGDFNSTPSDPAYLSLVSKPFELKSPSESHLNLYSEIIKNRNCIDARAISLYSVGYKLVDPTNLSTENDHSEAAFSIDGPRGYHFLDYIFVVSVRNAEESSSPDTVSGLEITSYVRLLSLLSMPCELEITKCLPQMCVYPSDQLCMMADVELI